MEGANGAVPTRDYGGGAVERLERKDLGINLAPPDASGGGAEPPVPGQDNDGGWAHDLLERRESGLADESPVS